MESGWKWLENRDLEKSETNQEWMEILDYNIRFKDKFIKFVKKHIQCRLERNWINQFILRTYWSANSN